MSIREKLAALRKKQETQKGENEQRFNDSHDKEQDLVKKRELEIIELERIATAELAPILEETNTNWFNGRGEVSFLSNEHGLGKRDKNWEYAVTARLLLDTGQDEHGRVWGKGIRITIGDNLLLEVGSTLHTETVGARRPELKSRRRALHPFEVGRYDPRGGGPTEVILNSRSHYNDANWKDHIESDVVKLLERGGENYDFNVSQPARTDSGY